MKYYDLMYCDEANGRGDEEIAHYLSYENAKEHAARLIDKIRGEYVTKGIKFEEGVDEANRHYFGYKDEFERELVWIEEKLMRP